MKPLGLVFSNINDANIPELTSVRTMGSVPYGGRYRLIDFVLSNMVNSGISKIGVVTKNNYQSLMDHLGSGKEYDLARKEGGLMLLPPFGIANLNETLYTFRMDMLRGAFNFLSKSKEENVVLSDCDVVMNLKYDEVVKYHEDNMADLTMVYRKSNLKVDESRRVTKIDVDDKGMVVGISSKIHTEGQINQYLKVLVIKRELLIKLVNEAISRGKSSFETDVLLPAINTLKVCAYEYDGYFACIDSLQNYFRYSLDLLDKENRELLFGDADRQIYTKVKDSPPTRYGKGARVSNSLIADGCVIEGTVENCILFRGTKVGKCAVIKNCVLMQDTIVGDNADLNCCITDKNVIIRDKVNLSGHYSLPFYISKSKTL
ncbi:MAG: glucose-1-phosphate adenylyltransferase subunit GlgD [Clostridia bacterium]|nr:glucose-1-phosphate adenylyltransferase subunit GlgD [Clostridia bacterium]